MHKVKSIIPVLALLLVFIPSVVRASDCAEYDPYTGQCEETIGGKVVRYGGALALIAAATVFCSKYGAKGTQEFSKHVEREEEDRIRESKERGRRS